MSVFNDMDENLVKEHALAKVLKARRLRAPLGATRAGFVAADPFWRQKSMASANIAHATLSFILESFPKLTDSP